jgi:hypothetical protein
VGIKLLLNFQGGQKSCGLFAKIELFSKPTQKRPFKGSTQKVLVHKILYFLKNQTQKMVPVPGFANFTDNFNSCAHTLFQSCQQFSHWFLEKNNLK